MKYRLRKPNEGEIRELETAIAKEVASELGFCHKRGLSIARAILEFAAIAVIEDLPFEEEDPEDFAMPVFVWRKVLVCIGAPTPKVQVYLFVWRNGKPEPLCA